MKRSSKISLLVLGTAALMTGCSSADQDDEVRQKQYASKAECQRDWDDSRFKDACTSTGRGGAYMGPRYYWNHSAGVPVAMMPDGSHRQMSAAAVSRSSLAGTSHSSVSSRSASVSRGGFGGFGRGSAGG